MSVTQRATEVPTDAGNQELPPLQRADLEYCKGLQQQGHIEMFEIGILYSHIHWRRQILQIINQATSVLPTDDGAMAEFLRTYLGRGGQELDIVLEKQIDEYAEGYRGNARFTKDHAQNQFEQAMSGMTNLYDAHLRAYLIEHNTTQVNVLDALTQARDLWRKVEELSNERVSIFPAQTMSRFALSPEAVVDES